MAVVVDLESLRGQICQGTAKWHNWKTIWHLRERELKIESMEHIVQTKHVTYNVQYLK